MTHSPARPFERDSPHQNLKLRLSHRGWPNRRFLGELSRFWSSRAYSIEWYQKVVKFWFRWVANAMQTQTFCVSIWLIAPPGHLKGIPHIKISNRGYRIGVEQIVVFSSSWVDFGTPGPIPLNETRKLWNFDSDGWLMLCKHKRFVFPYDS